MIIIYNSFISPYLFYCNIIWGNSPKYLIDHIFTLQKRFIRLIFNLKSFDSTQHLFPILKIMTIRNIFTYSSSIFIFKFIHNLLPAYYKTFYDFSSNFKLKTTPKTPTFYLHKTRLTLLKNSIVNTGPRLWDDTIPLSIKNTNSIKKFKLNMKKFIFTFKPP